MSELTFPAPSQESKVLCLCVSHLLGIMADDLPLQLLGGAELEGQLKEGQPEERGEERRGEERNDILQRLKTHLIRTH